MIHNFQFHTITEALPRLSNLLLSEGVEKTSRTGGVLECRAVSVTLHDPLARYVQSEARAVALPALIAETAWVLAGMDDINWLAHYLPRARDFSDDGETWRAAYGPRIRNFGDSGLDQLDAVVKRLRADPTTRQAVMTIWDADEDGDPELVSKDIPCNNWLHFLPDAVRNELHLFVSTRSNDLIWGWSGINAFEWSVLLEVVAKLSGFAVGSIHYSISSLHLYDPYRAKAARIRKEGDGPAPMWAGLGDNFKAETVGELDTHLRDFFTAEEVIRLGKRNPGERMNRIETVSDPMFREWLYVLESYWNGTEEARKKLCPAVRRTLDTSPILGEAKKRAEVAKVDRLQRQMAAFHQSVADLHDQKHAAYGDSWKRRGEALGILANVARKVDRLGTGLDTPDETQLDTATDLWVYLLKYEEWLREARGEEGADSGSADRIRERIMDSGTLINIRDGELDGYSFSAAFDELQTAFESRDEDGLSDYFWKVKGMAEMAGVLAFRLYRAALEQAEKDEWVKGNATRTWNGYGEDDE